MDQFDENIEFMVVKGLIFYYVETTNVKFSDSRTYRNSCWLFVQPEHRNYKG